MRRRRRADAYKEPGRTGVLADIPTSASPGWTSIHMLRGLHDAPTGTGAGAYLRRRSSGSGDARGQGSPLAARSHHDEAGPSRDVDGLGGGAAQGLMETAGFAEVSGQVARRMWLGPAAVSAPSLGKGCLEADGGERPTGGGRRGDLEGRDRWPPAHGGGCAGHAELADGHGGRRGRSRLLHFYVGRILYRVRPHDSPNLAAGTRATGPFVDAQLRPRAGVSPAVGFVVAANWMASTRRGIRSRSHARFGSSRWRRGGPGCRIAW